MWGTPGEHVDLTAEPAPGDRRRPRPAVNRLAFAPLTALAPGASRMLERLAPPPEAADDARRRPARPWRLLVLGCLALAALSLTLPSVPTYDPWAWIIWGREIAHGDLVTTTGPSWKPLPVIFTTPFSLAGDDGAPLLWLVVARAGGILAFAMAFRLGKRLAGPVAGVIAAGALFLADEFIRNFFRGNSEGILVALCLWAIERHLDGRRRDAFLLGLAAALLRPEVWPFIALYGLYLIAADWHRENQLPVKTTALVLGGGLGLGSSGSCPSTSAPATSCAPPPAPASRTRTRRRSPRTRSSRSSTARASVLSARRSTSAACSPSWRRCARSSSAARRACMLAMAAIGTVLMVAVAAMTQAGLRRQPALRRAARRARVRARRRRLGMAGQSTNARFGTIAARAARARDRRGVRPRT